MLVRDVRDESCDKLADRQCHDLLCFCIVVQIFKGDQSPVIFFDSGFADRRSFQVSSTIFDCRFKVVGLFVEMDDPCFIVKLRSP